MKKANKKGFTIVELVIVIAVIAILAAVLIPTFATVTERANKSKAMQQARIAYENYLADNAYVENADGTTSTVSNINLCIEVDGYHFYVKAGQFDATANSTCESGSSAKRMKIDESNKEKLVEITTNSNNTETGSSGSAGN